MDIAKSLIAILIAGVLTQNFILTKFLGICPFLGVTKKLSGAFGMGVAVTFTMVIATVVTYPIYTNILVPLKIEYMDTIAFILVIALIVQFLEMFTRKYVPPLYKALGIYLPLITTNCAILGVAKINVVGDYNYGFAIFNAFCSGLGFLIVMVIFASIRERIEHSDIPSAFKGAPITLIAAAIVSLSLIGFSGIG